MSAIGSYVCMRSADLERCLALAREANDMRPFRWPWQPKGESSREAFEREWRKATLEEVVFEGSGHLLTSYFLAQSAVNELTDPFDQPEGAILGNVFTAAFVAREALALPEMERGALQRFCGSEWRDDGEEMCSGILAAHRFLQEGSKKVGKDSFVVFVVS